MLSLRCPTGVLIVSFALAGASLSAKAQSYSVRDIGVITGASYVFPKAIAESGGVVRVVGTTSDKFGNGFHGYYWDSTLNQPVDIGTLGSATSSTPKSVNGAGDVVGNSNSRAFYWNPSRGAKNPIQLPYPPGYDPAAFSSGAARINNAGVIVGSLYSSSTGGIPVYWKRDAAGQFVCNTLLELTGSQWVNDRGAADLNERGDICGFVGSPSAYNHTRAVMWRNIGTASDPAYGPPSDAGIPDTATWPNSDFGLIAENGVVAGGHEDASGGYHRLLLNVDTPGVVDSYTVGGVNGFGETGATVGWTYEFDGGKRRAYLHRYGQTSINLGILVNLSSATSTANGVNTSETVVGSATVDRSGLPHAFRWTTTTGIKDLNTLTPSLGVFQYLRSADHITDTGRIAGQGVIKGNYTHTFVLTPVP